jgi:carboxyl-terminal processing protease
MEDTNKPITTSEEKTNSILKLSKSQAIGSAAVILVFVFASYVFGLRMGAKGYILQPKDFKVVNQSDAPKDVDYSLLWKAIEAVNENFIDKPVSPEKFLYGAVKGAVEATGDQYTQFFTPEELAQFKTDLKGSFDGIGAEVGKQNDNIVIVAPLEGSPAQRAGLKAKDVIVKVNGESTAGWSVDQAVNKIRGPKGTDVTLTIFRDGKTATFDVKITRAKIEIKSVKFEMKEMAGKKIGVITVSRFGDDTKDLFDAAVNNLLSSGA